MTTREIGRHTRPVYDIYSTRTRAVGTTTTHYAVRTDAHVAGNQSCVFRFFKADELVYEEASQLLMSGAAKHFYAAYNEIIDSWRHKTPIELRKSGFRAEADGWDRGEVNGKGFPRI